MESFGLLIGHLIGDYIVQNDWMASSKTQQHFPCLAHCLLYTLAVWLCSCWWMPWWGLLVIFGLHFPVDRWRFAKWWMVTVSGQKSFAEGPLSPWSIIVVDNTIHLIVLFTIGLLS